MGQMEVLNEAMMIGVWGLSVRVRAHMIGPMDGLCLESRFEKFGDACMSYNPLNSHDYIEKVSSLDLDSSSKSLQKVIRLTSQSSFVGALKVDAQV